MEGSFPCFAGLDIEADVARFVQAFAKLPATQCALIAKPRTLTGAPCLPSPDCLLTCMTFAGFRLTWAFSFAWSARVFIDRWEFTSAKYVPTTRATASLPSWVLADSLLGPGWSQVRSLTLDKVDPFLMSYLRAVGNVNSNAIWEATLSGDKVRGTALLRCHAGPVPSQFASAVCFGLAGKAEAQHVFEPSTSRDVHQGEVRTQILHRPGGKGRVAAPFAAMFDSA